MDINQAAAEMQAKENQRIVRAWFKKPGRVIYWPLYGLRYRLLMRAMHRLGWCYMKPSIGLRDDRGKIPHWCEWCGMRGTK